MSDPKKSQDIKEEKENLLKYTHIHTVFNNGIIKLAIFRYLTSNFRK